MIIKGDCIEEMKKLGDNSVDAIVTDPPYGLEFMGKKWDYDVPSVEVWKEALRVLKPGGFLLSFGGTRTYHRMAVNIEDAGFEIRDMISWLYGSGFPKSLNIGKQVDKINGNERENIGEGKGKSYVHQNKVNVEQGFRPNDYYKDNEGKFNITKGNSEWEGWGTSMKPAHEPIVVARKPLSEKNVALNVLKWGTGGINIDACRIEHNEPLKETTRCGRDNAQVMSSDSCGFDNTKNTLASASPQGRFPANILLDEEAGKILDEQTGLLKSGDNCTRTKVGNFLEHGGLGKAGDVQTTYGDKGGASRFFYCAKSSKAERNYGCNEIKEKFMNGLDKMGGEKCGMLTGSGNPRIGVNSNNHPTVKPIRLMEYLIKLVSREGAVVLDPFLGSGTTAIACIKLNRKWIGIEKEVDYIKIAEARIKKYSEQTKLTDSMENGKVESELHDGVCGETCSTCDDEKASVKGEGN